MIRRLNLIRKTKNNLVVELAQNIITSKLDEVESVGQRKGNQLKQN